MLLSLSIYIHFNYTVGLSTLFQSCKMLRIVHLRRCILVDDDCIEALSLNCPQLLTLNISGCINVTDRGLQCLSVNCKGIQSIDLSRTKVCCWSLYASHLLLLTMHIRSTDKKSKLLCHHMHAYGFLKFLADLSACSLFVHFLLVPNLRHLNLKLICHVIMYPCIVAIIRCTVYVCYDLLR